MGTTAPAQRVLLGEGRSHRRRALFTGAHHRCLGFRNGLPYSTDRGQKSVNRQDLDDLKRQIPLMGYLQAHDWHPARPLSRGRWMGRMIGTRRGPSAVADGWGCALCMEITNQASWWIPAKTCSTATVVAAAAM